MKWMFDGRYDVAISYSAGDNDQIHDYVASYVEALELNGIQTYDYKKQIDRMWGKGLDKHLEEIFRRSRNCVVFITKDLGNSRWAAIEIAAASDARGCLLLPVRLDGTQFSALVDRNIVAVDASEKTPMELARLTIRKLRQSQPPTFLKSDANLLALTLSLIVGQATYWGNVAVRPAVVAMIVAYGAILAAWTIRAKSLG